MVETGEDGAGTSTEVQRIGLGTLSGKKRKINVPIGGSNVAEDTPVGRFFCAISNFFPLDCLHYITVHQTSI